MIFFLIFFPVVYQPHFNLAGEGKEEKSLYTLSHLISSLDPPSSPASAEGKRGL